MYLMAAVFSLTGYLGINFVLVLVRSFGALLAVTGNVCYVHVVAIFPRLGIIYVLILQGVNVHKFSGLITIHEFLVYNICPRGGWVGGHTHPINCWVSADRKRFILTV